MLHTLLYFCHIIRPGAKGKQQKRSAENGGCKEESTGHMGNLFLTLQGDDLHIERKETGGGASFDRVLLEVAELMGVG